MNQKSDGAENGDALRLLKRRQSPHPPAPPVPTHTEDGCVGRMAAETRRTQHVALARERQMGDEQHYRAAGSLTARINTNWADSPRN